MGLTKVVVVEKTKNMPCNKHLLGRQAYACSTAQAALGTSTRFSHSSAHRKKLGTPAHIMWHITIPLIHRKKLQQNAVEQLAALTPDSRV